MMGVWKVAAVRDSVVRAADGRDTGSCGEADRVGGGWERRHF